MIRPELWAKQLRNELQLRLRKRLWNIRLTKVFKFKATESCAEVSRGGKAGLDTKNVFHACTTISHAEFVFGWRQLVC